MLKELAENTISKGRRWDLDERDLADQFIETFLALGEGDGSDPAALEDVATVLERRGHQFASLIIRNTVLRWESHLPLSPYVELEDGLIHKPLSRIVIVEGNEVRLGHTANKLLFYFRSHPNSPITDTELRIKIWDGLTSDSLVRTSVGLLRRKIETNPLRPSRLITVGHRSGWGYIYRTSVPDIER